MKHYELVEKIFKDHAYPVLTNAVALEATKEEVEINLNSAYCEGQTEIPSGDYLVPTKENKLRDNLFKAAILGRPGMTGNAKEDENAAMYDSEHHVTIDTLIELFNIEGRLVIRTAAGMLDVYDTVEAYLTSIEELKFTSVNYKAPDETDIIKMQDLVNGLRYCVRMIEMQGEDLTRWSAFEGGMGIQTGYTFDGGSGSGGGSFGNLVAGEGVVTIIKED